MPRVRGEQRPDRTFCIGGPAREKQRRGLVVTSVLARWKSPDQVVGDRREPSRVAERRRMIEASCSIGSALAGSMRAASLAAAIASSVLPSAARTCDNSTRTAALSGSAAGQRLQPFGFFGGSVRAWAAASVEPRNASR